MYALLHAVLVAVLVFLAFSLLACVIGILLKPRRAALSTDLPPARGYDAWRPGLVDQIAIGRFLAECTVRDPRCTVAAVALRDVFNAWARANALPPLTVAKLARALAERGIDKDRRAGGTWLVGLRLLKVPADFVSRRGPFSPIRAAAQGAGGGSPEPPSGAAASVPSVPLIRTVR